MAFVFYSLWYDSLQGVREDITIFRAHINFNLDTGKIPKTAHNIDIFRHSNSYFPITTCFTFPAKVHSKTFSRKRTFQNFFNFRRTQRKRSDVSLDTPTGSFAISYLPCYFQLKNVRSTLKISPIIGQLFLISAKNFWEDFNLSHTNFWKRSFISQ